MAMYLTKSMLKKLNKVKYPRGTFKIENDDASTSEDHWEKLFMDSKSGLSLSKDMICRVCARRACTPLSYKFEGCDIMGALRSVTNISISVDDSLPKFICNECFEALRHVMNFKQKCETTDKRLRKILNPEGDPLFHSYPYSKHDFQLILHQMKLKRMKIEEQMDSERKKRERMSQKKNLKAKEFKCSPCDMTFNNKEELVCHRRERQCMRRACDVCGQLVVSIAHHMRHIHKDKAPHKCPTCGKEFPIVTRLKNHMIVHSNTFNFFCDLCPYKCKYKYYLVMHMRTHTGEKPYRCAECPASFVNPSNLNKHKLTHQEKQFKCMLCEKAFRTNAALREHHQATHMNIKHTCGQCGRDFCYRADLRKHEVRSHNRTKRDYVGGEPAYKQAERLQRTQVLNNDFTTFDFIATYHQADEALAKWPPQQTHPPPHASHPPPHASHAPPPHVSHPPPPHASHAPPPPAPHPPPPPQPQLLPFVVDKEFSQSVQHMYFSDVTGLIQQQPIAQQHTVQILPELVMKKDEVKMYETQQGMGYF